MTALPDAELVRRARQDIHHAFGELVRRYQVSVFNVCYRILGHRLEAEDLTQEAFIRAHRRLDTFDVDRPFGPWIRRIATNLCLNHLKRSGPARVSLDEEREMSLATQQDDPMAAALRAEEADRVRRAILSLPPHYRAVIELRHFQELSYAEIAETLHLPLSDVRTHLYRARKALGRRLKEEDE